MKRLTCEICGSTDIIKQDGLYVCQACGTKYTVDEAKKMMVEGTVEIEGTVKVDQSDELKNLYEIARRAKQDNNSKNAQKYYEQILVKDPGSWEANFYTVYYQSMNCKIGEIAVAANRLTNCENSVLKLIRANVDDAGERRKALSEITLRLIDISRILFEGYLNHYAGIGAEIRSNYTQECITTCIAAINILYQFGDNVITVLGDEYGKDISVPCWKTAIGLHKGLDPILLRKQATSHQKVIENYEEKIHRYDTSFRTSKGVRYDEIVKKIDDGSSSSKYYAKIRDELKDFGDFEDSADQISRCEAFYNKALAREQKQKSKGLKIAGIIVIIVIVLVIIIAVAVKHTNTGNGSQESSENVSSESDESDMTAAAETEESVVEAGEAEEMADENDEDAEQYLLAEQYLDEGNIAGAAITFGKISDYQDARERSMELWKTLDINTIATGTKHTVAVKSDGTVVATGDNESGQCDVSGWTDIVSVACNDTLTLGIKIDGTIVSAGAMHLDQTQTLKPSNVIDTEDVYAISFHRLLYAVNTLSGPYITQYKDNDILEKTNAWNPKPDTLVCSKDFICGLYSDGTVVTTGDYDVSDWSDVVYLTCDVGGIFGIKSDGTVLSAVTESSSRNIDTSDWSDMVYLSVDNTCAVGVQSDGKVKLAGTQIEDCDVSDWDDIVRVDCDMPLNSPFIIGLKSNGTLVATGDNTYGQCNVSDWNDILVPDN